MYEVAVCGTPAAQLHAYPAHSRVVRLPDPAEAEFLDAGADLARRLDPDVPVVLLHASRASSTRRARLLRALARTHMVVPAPSMAPPTALAARATLLAHLAEQGVAAEHAVRAVDQHAGIVTLACVSTLAGVDLPGIGLRLHAATKVPGVNAGVVAHREQIAVAVNKLPALPALPTPLDRVVLGNPTLENRLAAALPPVRETADLDEVSPATRWWVRGQFFEQSLVPADPEALVARALEPTTERCGGCGQTSGGCPRCTNRQEYAA